MSQSEDVKKIVQDLVAKSIENIKNNIINDVLNKIQNTKNDKITDIIIILDRSGSMYRIQDDMEGALKEFVKEQKNIKGEAFVTLARFDEQIENVYTRRSLKEIDNVISIEPRGMTALLDAIGSTITSLSSYIPKDNLVVCVIITDGHENASKEYNIGQVKKLIKDREKDNNWKFVFLGANQDSFAEAGKLGINIDSTTNYHPDKIGASVAGFSSNVSQYRVSKGATTMNFTKEQQEDFEKPDGIVSSSDSSIADDGNKYKTID